MGFRGQPRGRPHCCGVMARRVGVCHFSKMFMLCPTNAQEAGVNAEGAKITRVLEDLDGPGDPKWNRYRDLKQGGLARARPFPYLRTQCSPFSATIDSKLDLQNAIP